MYIPTNNLQDGEENISSFDEDEAGCPFVYNSAGDVHKIINFHFCKELGDPYAPWEAAARWSLEYFIAAEKSEATNPLKDKIGEGTSPLTRAELEEVISEVMKA